MFLTLNIFRSNFLPKQSQIEKEEESKQLQPQQRMQVPKFAGKEFWWILNLYDYVIRLHLLQMIEISATNSRFVTFAALVFQLKCLLNSCSFFVKESMIIQLIKMFFNISLFEWLSATNFIFYPWYRWKQRYGTLEEENGDNSLYGTQMFPKETLLLSEVS